MGKPKSAKSKKSSMKSDQKESKSSKKSSGGSSGSSSASGSGGSGSSKDSSSGSKSGGYNSGPTIDLLGGDDKPGTFRRIACVRYVRPMQQDCWGGYPRYGYQPYCNPSCCPPPYGYGYYPGEFPASRKLLIIPPRNENQYRKAKKSDLGIDSDSDEESSDEENDRRRSSSSKKSKGDDLDETIDYYANANPKKHDKTKYYRAALARKYPCVDWRSPINATTSIITIQDPTCNPKRQSKVITVPCGYQPLRTYQNRCANPCTIANRVRATVLGKYVPPKEKRVSDLSKSTGNT